MGILVGSLRPTTWSATVFAVLLGVCLACGFGEPTDDIVFVTPIQYVVKQGDDVAKIARIHHVDVVELIQWNDLLTDAPDVGSTILVWPHGTLAMGAVATAEPAPGSPASGPRQPQPGRARPTAAGGTTTADVAPLEEPEGVAPDRTAPVAGGVRRAGLLGADVLGGDGGSAELDLEGASSGMQRHDTSGGHAGIGDNSALGSGGEAETLAVRQREMATTGPQIPDRPVTAPRVAKPPPKRCLPPTATQIDENGVARESGLDTGQITAGMAAISRYTPRCFPQGTLGSYSMIVEVTVGCDGRVKNVYTVSPGSIPAAVTTCVEQTVSSAGFAAHGVPDGMSFQYPMKFRF